MASHDDVLVTVAPLLDMVGDWGDFLSEDLPEEEIGLLRSHERTSRPLGSERFISLLENTSGLILRRQKPGRKPKQRQN
jgi:putative transposase